MQQTVSFYFKQFSRYSRKTANNMGIPDRDIHNIGAVRQTQTFEWTFLTHERRNMSVL